MCNVIGSCGMGVGFQAPTVNQLAIYEPPDLAWVPFYRKTDAMLLTRRTPAEWLRAFPDSRSRISRLRSWIIEHVDQKPGWTISRDLDIDFLPGRIAVKEEAGH